MAKKRKRLRPVRQKRVQVHKVALVPKQVLSVTVPPDHTPLVVTTAERRVEVVSVPVKKKKGWWETFLYGDSEN